MARQARPEERTGDPGRPSARADAPTDAAVGPGVPSELLRDAQRAAVDLLFFAPIGFAKRARKLLPDLIREGRSTAASARTIGKFVTPIARKQGTKLVKAKVAEITGSTLPKSRQGPRSVETAEGRPAVVRTAKPKVARPGTTGSAEASPKDPSIPHEPFAGYDHLGSAAVVARLGELSRAERSAVRAYETAHRNRRTVLGRLDQLEPSR